MNEIFLRRLIGAAVVFGFAYAIAALLPEPSLRTGAVEPVVQIDLRSAAPVPPPVPRPADAQLPATVPTITPRALTLDETLGSVPTSPASPPPPAPAPAPAAVAAKPAPLPAGGAESWWVQLGSFSTWENAHRALLSAQARGDAGVIQTVERDGKKWFRVRVGPLADRAQATEKARQLAGTAGLGAPSVARDDGKP